MSDELSDQEKSVMLARAMGWEVYPMYEGSPMMLFNAPGDEVNHSNLYLSENMALAWRVLNWGLVVKPTDPVGSIHSPDRIHNKLEDWLRTTFLWGRPDAQKQWLDQVLELAIEAGLMEVAPK